MISQKDRRHADLAASFFSQIAVAFVAAAFLQILLPALLTPAQTAFLLVAGLFFYGSSHVILELSFWERT